VPWWPKEKSLPYKAQIPQLTRISHEEHQTECKNNTILINSTLIYLKFGIADCNSAK
jgi:hypothetical protein